MKIIIAFIRSSKEEAVREALHGIPGLIGASFSDARGFGRGRGHIREEAAQEAVVGTISRVRVEIMLPDSISAAVQDAIALAAHTGRRGDGKIYELPLGTARRISTGETGEAAL